MQLIQLMFNMFNTELFHVSGNTLVAAIIFNKSSSW